MRNARSKITPDFIERMKPREAEEILERVFRLPHYLREHVEKRARNMAELYFSCIDKVNELKAMDNITRVSGLKTLLLGMFDPTNPFYDDNFRDIVCLFLERRESTIKLG